MPYKSLTQTLPKHSGRDNSGKISTRHQGGRHKRRYRLIDFKRDKQEVYATVARIEYDPNRTANIALVTYADGQRSYIIAPHGLKVGDKIMSGESAAIAQGNALPLKNIPVGTPVHNIELTPGQGAKLIRAAGVQATVLAKEDNLVHIKFPSGEVRKIPGDCLAAVGQVGHEEWRHEEIGSAGRARRMGRRPQVRGVAQNPRTHPHGGGEGRSGIGMKSPKSPWGKRTLGKKTRVKKKYSDKYIVKRRK